MVSDVVLMSVLSNPIRRLVVIHNSCCADVVRCGQAGNCNVMVLDLLGDSLEALYTRCDRKFSLKTVLMLAIQLLDRIEFQHNQHYLHRDIKPDNCLMGLGDKKHVLYCIDMGLCKRYRDPITLKHIVYKGMPVACFCCLFFFHLNVKVRSSPKKLILFYCRLFVSTACAQTTRNLLALPGMLASIRTWVWSNAGEMT